MKALTIVLKNRVNSGGNYIRSLYLADLEWLKDYSRNTKHSKTIKSAINALNKASNEEYANCYTSSCHYKILGKIKTAYEAGTSFTVYNESEKELFNKFKTNFDIDVEKL